MTSRQILGLTSLIALVGSGGGRAAAEQAAKPIPPSAVQRFGMIGIAPGQTARLNVVNADVARADGGRIDDGCPVELIFVDAAGREAAADSGTVRPGEAIFLDLPLAAGGRGSERRLQIRGVVRSTPGLCADLIATVEVFDAPSGRTTLALTPRLEPVCSDAQEPNDTFETASTLGAGAITGRVCPEDDDFFAITVAAGGGAFSATINFVNAEGDLDLVLYSPTGQQIAKSDGSSNVETVSVPDAVAGVYRLHVFGYFGAAAGYGLSLIQ